MCIGDALLQSVAAAPDGVRPEARTPSAVRAATNSSCCWPRSSDADAAASSAQKIIAALVAPHDVAHHQLHITATIGISIYPDDGADAETLIKCADTAMYHAKDRGAELRTSSSSRK